MHAERFVPGPHGCVEHVRQLRLALWVFGAHVKLHSDVNVCGPVGNGQSTQLEFALKAFDRQLKSHPDVKLNCPVGSAQAAQ